MLSLEPQALWRYFHEITRIPRPSKKEGQIIAYLQAFGREHGLDTRTDRAGNVLIRKPAVPGREHHPAIVLQAHLDMVCEKRGDVAFDFDHDPIQYYIEDDWVKARGTTLGADNGIGMAMMLALLAADDLPHPPLECLFTVDEETGLTGASALEADFLSGRTLINLDSEDDGEIFVGCAGGIDTVARIAYRPEPAPQGYFPFKITVNGLRGGHSGDDIDKGTDAGAVQHVRPRCGDGDPRHRARPALGAGVARPPRRGDGQAVIFPPDKRPLRLPPRRDGHEPGHAGAGGNVHQPGLG